MRSRFEQRTLRNRPGVFCLRLGSALAAVAGCMAAPWAVRGDSNDQAALFQKQIRPILERYCFDCHGDGAEKGNVAFDQFKTDQDVLENHSLWLKALKNLRAGLMPP